MVVPGSAWLGGFLDCRRLWTFGSRRPRLIGLERDGSDGSSGNRGSVGLSANSFGEPGEERAWGAAWTHTWTGFSTEGEKSGDRTPRAHPALPFLPTRHRSAEEVGDVDGCGGAASDSAVLRDPARPGVFGGASTAGDEAVVIKRGREVR